MTALTRRRRIRIAAVVAGTALTATAAAAVAGIAAAQPPLPVPGDKGRVCILTIPDGSDVTITPTGPGPHLAVPAAPLPPGVPLPDCPDIDPSGPIVVAPAQPGGPQVIIERGGPGVVHVQPARPAPTGSSGS